MLYLIGKNVTIQQPARIRKFSLTAVRVAMSLAEMYMEKPVNAGIQAFLYTIY